MARGTRFRGLADLHLHEWREGATISPETGRNSRLDAIVDAVAQVCRGDRPPFAVVAGDLVHSRSGITAPVLQALHDVLGLLNESFERTLIISGNHDYPQKIGRARISYLESLGGLGAYKRIDIRTTPGLADFGDVVIGALPWGPDKAKLRADAARLAELAAKRSRMFPDQPAARLLVGHQGFHGAARNDSNFALDVELEVLQIAPETAWDFAVFGDYHLRQWLAPRRLMLGSLTQHTRNEAGHESGAVDFDVVTGEAEPVVVKAPRFVRINAAIDKDLKAVKVALDAGDMPEVVLSPGHATTQRALDALPVPVKHEALPEPDAPLTVAMDATPREVVRAWFAGPGKAESPNLEPLLLEICDAVEAAPAVETAAAPFVEVVRVEGRNFLGYRALEFNFADAGLVFIDGRNLDDPTMYSCGAGKSTIFALVCWLFSGRTPKGARKTGVKYRWAKRGERLYGRLTLRISGGRVLDIERGDAEALALTLNGERLGVASQDEIERLTGYSPKLFADRALFGQGQAKTIGEATDAERKAFLEALVAGQRFDPYHEEAKQRRRDAQTESSRLAAEHASAEKIRAAAEQEHAREQTKRVKALEDHKRAVDVAETRVRQAAKQRDDAAAEAKRAELAREAIKARLAELGDRRKIEAREKAAERVAEDASTVVAELEAEIASLRRSEREINDTIEAVSKLLGCTCPTCKQAVPIEHANRVVHAQQDELTKTRSQLDDALADLDDARQVRDRVRANLRALGDELREEEKLRDRLNAADVDASRSKVRRERLAEDVEKAEAEVRRVKALPVDSADEKAALERFGAATRRLGELADQRATIDEKIRQLDRSTALLGAQGLRYYALASLAPRITLEANRVLEQISGGVLSIDLRAEVSGGAVKTSLDVRNRHGGAGYVFASGGESCKVDFALTWAVSEVARSQLNLLVLDESFRSLDRAAAPYLIDFLLSQTTRGAVLVISHAGELAELFPVVVTAVRQNNESRLMEGRQP